MELKAHTMRRKQRRKMRKRKRRTWQILVMKWICRRF